MREQHLQYRWSRVLSIATVLLSFGLFGQTLDPIASCLIDPQTEPITMHWKDGSGQVIGNIGTLKQILEREGRPLRLAMNGGMYDKAQVPVGLYIEDGRILQPIDRRPEGDGNFYLQPNGVFGVLTNGTAFVKRTAEMPHMLDVRYATQSGPMLVVDGTVNKLFSPGSRNLNIRNGVGVRKDGGVLFAISREPINFHAFATWFIQQGCTDALYLDGYVSRAYIPEEGLDQLDGTLGVLITVTGAR